MKRFTLTADHVALLRAANVSWGGYEWGAPGIDGKRPYGDGNLHESIARILGWDLFEDHNGDKHLSSEQYATSTRLHEETEVALQVVLATGSFEPGEYVASDYDRDWRRA